MYIVHPQSLIVFASPLATQPPTHPLAPSIVGVEIYFERGLWKVLQ